MKTVVINSSKIQDRETFHKEFAEVMGFPDFYGKNMDAWIDCLSDIGGGMTMPSLNTSESLCIELIGAQDFSKRLPELMKDLIECTALVNKSFSQRPGGPVDKNITIKFLE